MDRGVKRGKTRLSRQIQAPFATCCCQFSLAKHYFPSRESVSTHSFFNSNPLIEQGEELASSLWLL